MTTWQEKIREGMKLIIEGCKENTTWAGCALGCPFRELCDSIEASILTNYSTPDCYEEEGIFDEVK